MLDDHSFALCLTHDVDRPYKTYQSAYYAVADRDPYHLTTALPGRNPYWQFEELMALEDRLGVRSAFYFLDEQHLLRDRPVRDWFDPGNWRRYMGRYSLSDPDVVDLIHDLDRGGWEVGLHGSYESYDDRERLRGEKRRLESVLGREVTGGRQHYLNLKEPATWEHQSAIGLRYDASLGSSSTYGFDHGYGVRRPFDDAFVVFPTTIMEVALPDPDERFERAWAECRRLLAEARENRAVMTILWHPRYFNEREFPGFRELYRRIVERARELGAWIGPPAELYAALDHPDAEFDHPDAGFDHPDAEFDRPDAERDLPAGDLDGPGGERNVGDGVDGRGTDRTERGLSDPASRPARSGPDATVDGDDRE